MQVRSRGQASFAERHLFLRDSRRKRSVPCPGAGGAAGVHLEPDELQRLVLAAVDPYIDRDVLAREIAREEQRRRALEEFVGRWGAEGGEQS
ncbi:hypothetical protein [Streptomyces sp. NPDC023588]|uniref:hypothetical protein n=1 Tax=Streptomyces sp. NPDC023588 TaxID=3154907 RepID=UPI0033D15EB9